MARHQKYIWHAGELSEMTVACSGNKKMTNAHKLATINTVSLKS